MEVTRSRAAHRRALPFTLHSTGPVRGVAPRAQEASWR